MRIIGICGGSGSGKTALAKMYEKLYPDSILCISQDMYYKDVSIMGNYKKEEINFDHPDSFDVDLLCGNIEQLLLGKAIQYPIYSFIQAKRLEKTISVQPKDIVIVEGMLILYFPKLRKLIDKSIYIDVSERIRYQRMEKRDISERGWTEQSFRNHYYEHIQPMHKMYVEPQMIYADIIVNGNDKTENLIKVLALL